MERMVDANPSASLAYSRDELVPWLERKRGEGAQPT
jgi:hypothetical protein